MVRKMGGKTRKLENDNTSTGEHLNISPMGVCELPSQRRMLYLLMMAVEEASTSTHYEIYDRHRAYGKAQSRRHAYPTAPLRGIPVIRYLQLHIVLPGDKNERSRTGLGLHRSRRERNHFPNDV